MPRALYALAASTFAIGTTEFVIVGLIPGMARDLHVGLTTAGLLVSVYALAITLGAPLFTALTGHFDRRRLIMALMAVFLLGNVTAAFAPNFEILLAARVVTAVAHGVFFGAGAAVASTLVPRSKSSQAVAVMMGGLTIAMVLGVPLGSWLGESLGWRAPFLVVAGLALVALAALRALLPAEISHTPPESLLAQARLLTNPRLLTMYLLTAIGWGATFVVFTYISPLLTGITGISTSMVNVALVVFGIATVAGNITGGKLADRLGTKPTLTFVLIGTAIVLAGLAFTAHSTVAVFVNIAVWGFFAFAINPVLQAGVVQIAEDEAPDAVGTASGFNIAAFNLGISGGSFLGGVLVQSAGVLSTPWGGVTMAVVALGIATVALKRRAHTNALAQV
ncbi:MFS transporter [Amycolatopsis sp. CA-161197]|uniref:MFS transporter n=1 Tax=Amycolatopsis sp. CA-161197 TaxID=3239922 RepID=UPI003D90D1E5